MGRRTANLRELMADPRESTLRRRGRPQIEKELPQPQVPLAGGAPIIAPSADIVINEGEGMLTPFRGMPTVQDVANSLNALGVTPRDMMAIFQAMKQAGALQAELILK